MSCSYTKIKVVEDGLEYTVYQFEDGGRQYYLNGKLHRENGPSCIYGKDICYHKNGLLHNENGPAISTVAGGDLYFIKGTLTDENGSPIIESGKKTSYNEKGDRIHD